MTLGCPPGTMAEYPSADWDERLKKKWAVPDPENAKFYGVTLKLGPPDKAVDECAVLMRYKAERERRSLAIHTEAQGAIHAVAPVLAAAGFSTDDPVNLLLKQLREYLLDRLDAPVFYFKAVHLRARPWTCCGNPLAPMFMRNHWRYPGHPSYPSGHATQAYFFAYLFAKFLPHQSLGLLSAAGEVARNREIAGVHYPSDSEAGRLLAEQMADAFYSKLIDKKAKEPAIKMLRELIQVAGVTA